MFTRTKALSAAAAMIMFVFVAGAQELSFSTTSGGTLTQSGMRGKVTVLLFSGVQDPQCRDGLKALEALSDRFRGKPVQVYWVSVNSTSEATNDQLKSPCGGDSVASALNFQQ
jgi:hypothetical protein